MTEIIPALMPESFDELKQYAHEFAGLAQTVQLDVMDGVFVPPVSWPHTGDAGEFEAMQNEEHGLPVWDRLNYEVDLMVAEPENEIGAWLHSGVSRIIVHLESLKKPQEFFNSDLFVDDPKMRFVELGVALNIDTPIEDIAPHIEKVNFVQCMGIAEIGYQGQEFDDRVLKKVSALRETYPDLIISIDGGVGLDTAPQLIAAGANRLVSGSAILESDDPEQVIHELADS